MLFGFEHSSAEQEVDVIYLDFAKAFDSVVHKKTLLLSSLVTV
jgi:hypothetical protein